MRKRYFFRPITSIGKGEHSEFHWGINFRSLDSALRCSTIEPQRLYGQPGHYEVTCYLCNWLVQNNTHVKEDMFLVLLTRRWSISSATVSYKDNNSWLLLLVIYITSTILPSLPWKWKKKSGIFHVTFHHLWLLPRTDKGKFLFLKLMVMSSASENKSTKSVPVTLTRFCFCFCFFFLILLFSLTGLWKAAVHFPCKWLSTSSSQC